jgi:hypothetical protein
MTQWPILLAAAKLHSIDLYILPVRTTKPVIMNSGVIAVRNFHTPCVTSVPVQCSTLNCAFRWTHTNFLTFHAIQIDSKKIDVNFLLPCSFKLINIH